MGSLNAIGSDENDFGYIRRDRCYLDYEFRRNRNEIVSRFNRRIGRNIIDAVDFGNHCEYKKNNWKIRKLDNS